LDQEIDLRPYIWALIARWWQIAVIALVAAVAAFIVSSLIRPTYEAASLVAVTEPRYLLQFDPRFQTVNDIQPAAQAYPELAVSDDVLAELLAGINPRPVNVETLGELRRIVMAEPGADPSLVRLEVRSQEAEEAARIANRWAEIFVVRADQLYSGQTEEQVEFFAGQLVQAEADVAAADGALIEFQARNRASTIQNWLNSYRITQADYLTKQVTIGYLLQDIQGLRSQLAERPESAGMNTADSVTLLLLQLKALDVPGPTLQLDLGSEGFPAGQAVAEQIAYLDGLENTAEAKLVQIEGWLAETEPQILDLQRQLQEVTAEEQVLMRNQEVATATYMTLANKLEEARIAAEDTSGEVQLASRAAVPEEPVSPKRLLNTAVGGVIGLLLGVLGTLILAWRQEAAGQGKPASG
jgi:succinoglycan biosynthesis transport protein ExoP